MTRDELLHLIDRAAREGWVELDLRGQEVTEIPPEICKLTHLKKLYVGHKKWVEVNNNPLTSLPPEISQLVNLTTLGLRHNQLLSVPPEIARLKNLLKLDLGENLLISIPPEITQLTRLQSLSLGHNKFTTLPYQIVQMATLRELDLSGNKLRALPPKIIKLNDLRVLDLGGNPLLQLSLEVTRLKNIRFLSLWENQLTFIPSEIGNLSNLQYLDLGANLLSSLPFEIVCLTNLQLLELRNNKLGVLPLEITQLSNLKSLSLSDNQLVTIPSEIANLTKLRRLVLNNNQLSSLPPEIFQMAGLKSLYFSNNQIATLPASLHNLQKLEKLGMYGNPLPLPNELVGDFWHPGTPQAILDTYFQASRPLYEAKLLLVGEGGVGKTSLVERLLHNQPPSGTGKTIGVDIHRWEVALDKTTNRPPFTDIGLSPTDNRLRVNVWDFGGQEIYHATHQFFLTHRSLYLLVIEARKDEAANRLDYWLRHVQSFAGDAPIILVVNKSDQGRLALGERSLLLKYPAIRAIVHTSCVTGDGLPQLRQAIEEALAAMPHINDWIPLTWFEVKEQLAALDKDTLPYENYVELCQAAGIEHEAAQRTLARFLHDLGAALNFQDDRRLAGTHVLNPEWVTGGIYRILNAAKLQESGLLNMRDLDDILDRRRYPAEKQPFLLDIMGKFELSVPLDRERYLIPGLLPKARPAFDWPENAPVALEYRYAILPAAILSRLMVRLHSHIWQAAAGQPVRWRNGLVIHGDGCRALIAADPAANRLSISLDGPAPQRRQLLSAVRFQLDEIHASFAQLEAAEWVPIPGQSGKAIPYDVLLEQERRGQLEYYDPYIRSDVKVHELLDGIEAPDERKARPVQQKLVQHFNMEELRALCFELHVDSEMWPDAGKPALARNLVLYFLRQGRLAVLERQVREERPGLDW